MVLIIDRLFIFNSNLIKWFFLIMGGGWDKNKITVLPLGERGIPSCSAGQASSGESAKCETWGRS